MLYTKMMHLCSNSSLVQKYTDLFKSNFDSLSDDLKYHSLKQEKTGLETFKPKKKNEAQ